MARLITVYWRDIPSQVMARQGRTTVKRMLSPRFQEAIDRAAMRAGKGSSEAYLNEWRRVSSGCGPDLDAALETAAGALEAAYTDDDLTRLIRAKGIDVERPPESASDPLPGES
jgi:hypothetical protein